MAQVQGSGASGGGLALYQVATATISGDIYSANAADTGGGGIGATGYNSSSLLIQDSRHESHPSDGLLCSCYPGSMCHVAGHLSRASSNHQKAP